MVITVNPLVSDHPKYEDLVVAYGSWWLARVDPQGVWGPFLESPGNFSGPKANFKIKT